MRWHEPSGAWLVGSYAEVSALLVDDRLSSRTIGELAGSTSPQQRRDAAPLLEFFDSWLVLSDGATHASLRKAVAPVMSPAWAAMWTEALDELAASALSGSMAGSSADTYAVSFAGAAIGALLGVADDERAQVLGWSGELLRYMAAPDFEPERLEPALAALCQLRRYVVDVARSRTQWRGLPTLLCGAADLPDDAFLALFAQLVAGGADPVARTLATAARAVGALRLPIQDQTQRASLIEEALRFDPPFHLVPRLACADIELPGGRVRAGDRVLLMLASANRDEAVFDEPDRFLLRRARSGPHLSFGRGRHRCIGPAIARLELDCALRAVAPHARPGLSMADPAFSGVAPALIEPPGLL